YRHRLTEAADRDRAEATWAAFRDEARAAQFRLYTRTHEPDQLRQGVALAHDALGRYGALDGSDWLAQPLVTALPSASRTQLRDAAGELLMLLARAEALSDGGVCSKERAAGLAEAWRYNALAESIAPDLTATPGLWAQRAELATARGDET